MPSDANEALSDAYRTLPNADTELQARPKPTDVTAPDDLKWWVLSQKDERDRSSTAAVRPGVKQIRD